MSSTSSAGTVDNVVARIERLPTSWWHVKTRIIVGVATFFDAFDAIAIATVLPVLSVAPLAVFASGLLFGAVFLSLVASTTSLVRHNLAPAAWPAGIAAFTIVFAAGQIVGPSAVGFVADHLGGLRAGFAGSAAVLALAALVASRQRPLGPRSA